MKTNLQKALAAGLIALQAFMALAPAASAGEGEKRMLLVTAYYSPLPDQRFYIRGNYEADIRLNGRGTNGADGTEVFDGMLAAPKTYAFGTRVRIPGLGVGEVHDRGGAILAGRNYDRIDVWMGRGEEGLSRALNWGARLVAGEVFTDPDAVEPGLSYGHIGSTLPGGMVERLMKTTTYRPVQNPAVFDKPLNWQADKNAIRELQEALTSLGYYAGPVDGTLDEVTRKSLVNFQVTEGVIPNAVAMGAGNFGPKTRATLKDKLQNFNHVAEKEIQRLEENRLLLASGLGRDEEGDDVTALQRMLWDLGYYHGALNGLYDEATMDAVFEFQKQTGILQNEWQKGAGYYGKRTHEALVAAVNQKMQRVAKYPQAKQSWVPARVDLPSLADLLASDAEERHLSFSDDLIKKFVQETAAGRGQFSKDLELNDKNSEVLALQKLLIKRDYLPQNSATGFFGPNTQTALVKFQMDKGIIRASDDTGAGRVGPKTREALNKASA